MRRSIVLEGGQEISFVVAPSKDSEGEDVVEVAYRETNRRRAAAHLLRRFGYRASENLRAEKWATSSILKPAIVFAAIALFAVVFIFYLQSRTSKPAVESANTNQAPKVSPNEIAPSIPPDDAPQVNAGQTAPTPKPVKTDKQKSPKRVSGDAQVARLEEAPPSDTTLAEDEATRALRVERIAASLLTVKHIYIETSGDEILSDEVASALINALQPTGRFVVASNRDAADAVLKVSVRREQSRGKALVIARLVNANGEVLWPATPRGSGEKYLGPPTAVAGEMIIDLIDTVQELESQRKR